MLSNLTTLQAKILALVGWADGAFDDKERAVFRDVLEASPGDDRLRAELFRMADVAPEKHAVVTAVIGAPREVVAAALKNAFVLAKSDGNLDDAELALLDELAQAAGVSAARFDDFHRMLESHLSALELERELFGT